MTSTQSLTRSDPVSKTLAYADIFDYPLTQQELYHWLISPKPQDLPDLSSIPKTKNYYHLEDRQHLASLRQARKNFSRQKITKAKTAVRLLAHLPSIYFIGLTGALAMNNSSQQDDIDLIIITCNHTLWTTRLFATFLLEVFHLRRRRHGQTNNKICLNLFLDESSLALPLAQQNLYIAHEVAQVKPLLDRHQTYARFINQNLWVKKFLPHTLKGLTLKGRSEGADNFAWLKTKQKDQTLLVLINRLAYQFQLWYMKPKITTEKVSLHSAFFHPRPTGKIIMKEYQKRLKNLNIKP